MTFIQFDQINQNGLSQEWIATLLKALYVQSSSCVHQKPDFTFKSSLSDHDYWTPCTSYTYTLLVCLCVSKKCQNGWTDCTQFLCGPHMTQKIFITFEYPQKKTYFKCVNFFMLIMLTDTATYNIMLIIY